jgi:CRISPR/Cas system-associated exonuclease Cas4 (RecB family)
MSKFFKISIVASLIAIAIVMSFSPSPVQADAHETFDLYVKHNINGRSLGMAKELPVDVYVNGDMAFSFEFGDSVSTSLPAGEYDIEVKLAGTEIVVMSLLDAEIPAGVSVSIRATLGAEKTPTLRVNVK